MITIGARLVVDNDVEDDRDARAARNWQSRVVDNEESASARPETRSPSLASLAIGFHLDLTSMKISCDALVSVLMRRQFNPAISYENILYRYTLIPFFFFEEKF